MKAKAALLRVLSTISFTCLISSCAAVISVPRRVPFDEAPLARYARPGTGSISGSISAIDSYGSFHEGDQSALTLLPVSPYTTEMIERVLGDGENLAASDPRFRRYVRRAKADLRGHFTFTSVPAGEYYVVGLVEWSDMSDFDYRWSYERVRLGEGQHLSLQVTRDPHRPGKPYFIVWSLF